MKLCGICDLSVDLLRQMGDKLVRCVECADTVCTSCAQAVKDENGKQVYVCSECVAVEQRYSSRYSR